MKQLISSRKKDASTAYTSGIHIAIVMASDIDSEATNKCNELYTNLKPMENFMLGALGNHKVLLPKLHGRIQIWVLWNYVDEMQHGHCALTISIICLHRLSFL